MKTLNEIAEKMIDNVPTQTLVDMLGKHSTVDQLARACLGILGEREKNECLFPWNSLETIQKEIAHDC